MSCGDVVRYLLPIRVHAIKYHYPDICLNKFISLGTNFSFKREEDIHSHNKKFFNFLCVLKYLNFESVDTLKKKKFEFGLGIWSCLFSFKHSFRIDNGEWHETIPLQPKMWRVRHCFLIIYDHPVLEAGGSQRCDKVINHFVPIWT